MAKGGAAPAWCWRIENWAKERMEFNSQLEYINNLWKILLNLIWIIYFGRKISTISIRNESRLVSDNIKKDFSLHKDTGYLSVESGNFIFLLLKANEIVFIYN